MGMFHHQKKHRPRRVVRRLALAGLLVVVLLTGAIIGVRHAYYRYLGPVSNSQQTQIITIKPGSSVKQIAALLAKNGVIRTSWAFEWYVHSKELSAQLQAGTYAFAPSESLPQIVGTLTKGKVQTSLITILPGRRIDQVRADLINDGFSVAAVDAALKPANYTGLPVMSYAPAGVGNLEGLLYPDSFQRPNDDDPSVIIRQSLEEMGIKLTPDIRSAMANHGLNPYQGLTLASIIEKEVSNQDDRAQVAQVFYSRLAQNIALGSDPTAFYGSIIAHQEPSLQYDSPYNTLKHTGLPPSPISTVSLGSLQAVVSPASTNWLYFVAGDDGVTHFSQTLDQQQANTAQYCHKLCGH